LVLHDSDPNTPTPARRKARAVSFNKETTSWLDP
jgi:hypothetical protein